VRRRLGRLEVVVIDGSRSDIEHRGAGDHPSDVNDQSVLVPDAPDDLERDSELRGDLADRSGIGAAGTSFAFTVAGFKSGEVLHFAITSPVGKTTVGPAHTVTPAGTVSASYATTATSAVGRYAVKATGDRGSTATAGFDVTASRSSTTVRHANTTLHTTTTHHTTTTRH
jgi:hypothetical protein